MVSFVMQIFKFLFGQIHQYFPIQAVFLCFIKAVLYPDIITNKSLKEYALGNSLVAQWLRICLLM